MQPTAAKSLSNVIIIIISYDYHFLVARCPMILPRPSASSRETDVAGSGFGGRSGVYPIERVDYPNCTRPS